MFDTGGTFLWPLHDLVAHPLRRLQCSSIEKLIYWHPWTFLDWSVTERKSLCWVRAWLLMAWVLCWGCNPRGAWYIIDINRIAYCLVWFHVTLFMDSMKILQVSAFGLPWVGEPIPLREVERFRIESLPLFQACQTKWCFQYHDSVSVQFLEVHQLPQPNLSRRERHLPNHLWNKTKQKSKGGANCC